jgi:hypothetical protein
MTLIPIPEKSFILNQKFHRLHGSKHRVVRVLWKLVFFVAVCITGEGFSRANPFVSLASTTFHTNCPLCHTTFLQGSALSGNPPTWASAPDMWAPEVASLKGQGSALFFADSQAKDDGCDGVVFALLLLHAALEM